MCLEPHPIRFGCGVGSVVVRNSIVTHPLDSLGWHWCRCSSDALTQCALDLTPGDKRPASELGALELAGLEQLEDEALRTAKVISGLRHGELSMTEIIARDDRHEKLPS